MRHLYVRIYITIVVILVLFGLLSAGLWWLGPGQERRNHGLLNGIALLASRAIPSAHAPRSETDRGPKFGRFVVNGGVLAHLIYARYPNSSTPMSYLTSLMSNAKLLALHTDVVRPEWIDYNGHMNLAFFVRVFDFATDAFFDYIGMDEAYRTRTGYSLFLLETHVTYVNQMRVGDRMRFDTQLLDYDHKRVHLFHFMYHLDEAYLAATTELMFIHVDTTLDRSVAIPELVLGNLSAIMESHQHLERPADVGRVMRIRR